MHKVGGTGEFVKGESVAGREINDLVAEGDRCWTACDDSHDLAGSVVEGFDR